MDDEARFLKDARASFFCSKPYLDFLRVITRARVEKLTIRKNSRIQGMLYYMAKSGSRGWVFNSLPYYGSNPGLLVDPTLPKEEQDDIKMRLLRDFRDRAMETAYSATIIQGVFEDEDVYRKFDWDYVDDSRVAAVSVLPSTNLLGMFNDKARNQTRKYADIMEIKRVLNRADLEPVRIMHLRNMEAVGAPPKSKEFFDWVFNMEQPFVYSVKMLNRDEPVAGLIVFMTGDVMEYFMPAVDLNFRKYSPMNKLIYRAMQDGVISGARYWNWGGTKPASQPGVFHFKKQFHPSLKPYKYFTLFKGTSFPNGLLEEYKYFFVAPLDKFDVTFHKRGK